MSKTQLFSPRQFSRQFPGTFNRFYVWGKVSTDPLYPAIYAALAKMETSLLDVGCGIGLLAFYLREHGWNHPIHGVDIDGKKIALAGRLAHNYPGPLSFQTIAAGDPLPPHSGCVTLLDVLQYLSPEQRLLSLRDSAERVSADGLLIIRTGVQEANWRGRVTTFTDRIGSGIGWISTPAQRLPTLEEISSPLAGSGLVGEFKPLWGRTPFHNWLGVFRRKPQPPSTPLAT